MVNEIMKEKINNLLNLLEIKKLSFWNDEVWKALVSTKQLTEDIYEATDPETIFHMYFDEYDSLNRAELLTFLSWYENVFFGDSSKNVYLEYLNKLDNLDPDIFFYKLIAKLNLYYSRPEDASHINIKIGDILKDVALYLSVSSSEEKKNLVLIHLKLVKYQFDAQNIIVENDLHDRVLSNSIRNVNRNFGFGNVDLSFEYQLFLIEHQLMFIIQNLKSYSKFSSVNHTDFIQSNLDDIENIIQEFNLLWDKYNSFDICKGELNCIKARALNDMSAIYTYIDQDVSIKYLMESKEQYAEFNESSYLIENAFDEFLVLYNIIAQNHLIHSSCLNSLQKKVLLNSLKRTSIIKATDLSWSDKDEDELKKRLFDNDDIIDFIDVINVVENNLEDKHEIDEIKQTIMESIKIALEYTEKSETLIQCFSKGHKKMPKVQRYISYIYYTKSKLFLDKNQRRKNTLRSYEYIKRAVSFSEKNDNANPNEQFLEYKQLVACLKRLKLLADSSHKAKKIDLLLSDACAYEDKYRGISEGAVILNN